MYFILVWQDEATLHTDLDGALDEYAADPFKLRECLERHDTGATVHTAGELDDMLDARATDIAADERHDHQPAEETAS